MSKRTAVSLYAPVAMAVIALAGCGAKSEGGDAPAAAASAPAQAASGAASAARAAFGPPVSVTTVPARLKDFPIVLQAIGTAMPVSSVDVRSQLTSVVTKVHVTEGQFVKAGELLFTLDARNDEANVAKAKAQVARDDASLADARRQLARSKDLLAQNFVSQGAVDANQTQVEALTAALEGDRAALAAAQVGLSYTKIISQGAGRAGAINVFRGSAVQANQTSLVTITQLDPIDVGFSLPQRHLAGLLGALKNKDSSVTARLAEGGAELTGKLQFVDNAIDGPTGTVKVKARFENKTAKLWPGAYANVSLTAGVIKDAIVIPVGAIIESPRGSIVYVAAQGKALLRPVKTVALQGEEAAVTGVKPGERVVLDGRQNLRPEAPLVERPRDGASRPRGGASGAAAGGASAATPGERPAAIRSEAAASRSS